MSFAIHAASPIRWLRSALLVVAIVLWVVTFTTAQNERVVHVFGQ
jgi:hypothetical protein